MSAVERGSQAPDSRFRRIVRGVERNVVRLSAAASLGTLAVLATPGSNFTTDRLGLKTEVETVWSLHSNLGTPIGGMTSTDHAGPFPFGLDVRINGVSLENALKLTKNAEKIGKLPQDLESDLSQIKEEVKDHVERDLFVFSLGSLIGWIVGEGLTRKDKIGRKEFTKSALRTLLATSLLAGSLGGSAWNAYKSGGFENAELSSGLSFVQDNVNLLNRLDEHDEAIAKTVEGFLRLSDAINKLDPEQDAPTTSVMVVSDIHSRNVFSLLKTIIETNNVDMVIDAGDITEWGLGFESDYFTNPSKVEQWRSIRTQLSMLKVPYLIVKGNHDSNATMKALDSILNVVVLDGQLEIINGLKITGVGDPDYSPDDVLNGQSDRETLNEEIGSRLESLVDGYDPDIAIIHNDLAARKILDGVRIIISGHSHVCRAVLEVLESGTVYYNEGTSGGAGLRSLQPNNCEGESQEQPQTISVIYFDNQNKPYAVDEFIITSLDGRLEMRIKQRDILCAGDCAKQSE